LQTKHAILGILAWGEGGVIGWEKQFQDQSLDQFRNYRYLACLFEPLEELSDESGLVVHESSESMTYEQVQSDDGGHSTTSIMEETFVDVNQCFTT